MMLLKLLLLLQLFKLKLLLLSDELIEGFALERVGPRSLWNSGPFAFCGSSR